jgi:hypothetical protein
MENFKRKRFAMVEREYSCNDIGYKFKPHVMYKIEEDKGEACISDGSLSIVFFDGFPSAFTVYEQVEPFEEKFSPKPGDLITVVSPRGKSITLYKSGKIGIGGDVDSYATLHRTDGFVLKGIKDDYNDTTDWHLSTKSDRCEFFESMVKAGYRWNAKKLELTKVKSRFKIGDFVYWSGYEPHIAIILRHCNSFSDSWVICGINNPTGYNSSASEKNLRFATDQEQKKLLAELHGIGKTWNPELKRIEDIKWRAEKGEAYLYLFFEFGTACVSGTSDDRSSVDDMFFSSGNYFKTENSAQIFADKINELLKQNAK